ncbi:MAG TPA: cytidine deaminase [Balneolaceae bacterium]|nr:cytidine deaminase [Balneolaceae bacterium]
MDTEKLLQNSYTPYSGNPSVAIVESESGYYFPGCRIENISYPLSIDAEQSALFCCLSEGHKPAKLFVSDPKKEIIRFWEHVLNITIGQLDENLLSDNNFASITLNENLNIDQTLDDLLDAAVVGESNFPVSALLKTDLGYISGVNIECSAWNMGLCAERVAISKALSYGAQKLSKLHIHTRKGEFSSPCGACRQVIIEHMPHRQIHLHHADHSESIHFSEDLLPYSFSSFSLSNK